MQFWVLVQGNACPTPSWRGHAVLSKLFLLKKLSSVLIKTQLKLYYIKRKRKTVGGGPLFLGAKPYFP